MSNIVLLGGGGLALELCDYLRNEGIKPIGYCAPKQESGLNGIIDWLGDENEAHNEKFEYLIASGKIEIRKMMIEFLMKNRAKISSFISRQSYVSRFAKIGVGAVVLPFAAITGNPIIGDFLLLNTFASIHHDVEIGANAVLSPGARIPGFCKIADNFFMGLNASLVPGTKIGENVDVSINAYIGKKVSSNMTVIAKTGVVFAK